MTAPDKLSLSIPNQPESLSATMDVAEAFLETWSVDPGDRAQVMILLDEIASNIIRAAWPDGGQRRFSMDLTIESAPLSLRLVLLAVDDGVPFDPTDVPHPDPARNLDDWEPGGLGLLMIKSLSDSVEYSRTGGCNRLQVTKRLQRT